MDRSVDPLASAAARDRDGWRPPSAIEPRPAVPEWAEKLTRLLDDAVRIPGTEIRFGLDSVIGFFLPGAGDAATAVGSVALLFLALRSGVPAVVIGRMVLNIAIDALVGAVPFVGDLFDVAWKANRKNLDLITHYRKDPETGAAAAKPGAGEYALVGVGLLIVILSIALPILVLVLAGVQLGSLFGG